jgi:hypothetical protein
LNTATEAVPTARTSVAGISAVNWVELTKVVGKFAPFHRATEVLMKAAPVNVNVKAEEPEVVEFGVIVTRTGRGTVMMKVATLDRPPPGVGLKTVTVAMPEV